MWHLLTPSFCHSHFHSPFLCSFTPTSLLLCLILAVPSSAGTHSAVDGAEGHEILVVVGQGAAVGFPVGVLAPLQDELLALEVMVLESDPTGHMEEVRRSDG